MTTANKKIVHYVGKPIFYGELEHGAQIYPVDHPDRARVSNYKVAWTSSVLSYDPVTGRMETLNTVYMPLESGEGTPDTAKENP
jgi:hypothetical protein